MSTFATPDTPFWTDRPKTGEDRFRRITGWASISAFLIWIGFSCLAFAWNIDQRSLLHRVESDPFSVSIDELRNSDARADFLNHAHLVLFLVTAAVFITWLYVEYRRAARTSASTRFAPGWAIGGWFVPIWNWFRPFQVMEDVWKATAGRTKSVALVAAWWGCFLAATVALMVATSGDDPQTIDEALRTNTAYVVRSVLLVAAAVLALVMVRSVLRHPAGAVSSDSES